MSLKRPGVHLDIDPDRHLVWILLELGFCLCRLGAAWVRTHPRSTLALLVAIAAWIGTPMVDHHLGSLLADILRSRP